MKNSNRNSNNDTAHPNSEKLQLDKQVTIAIGDPEDKPALWKQFLGAALLVLICVLLIFLIASLFSDGAHVVVEINKIPNNWLVHTIVESNDSDDVSCGIRSTISSESVLFATNDKCVIDGATFIVDGIEYSNARIYLEPMVSMYFSGDSVYLDTENMSYPSIEICSSSGSNNTVEFEFSMGFSSPIVEQQIHADFHSFDFEFRSLANQRFWEENESATIVDVRLLLETNVKLKFENCFAYLYSIDDDEVLGINECECLFETDNNQLLIGRYCETQEYIYYCVTVPRESNFSMSSGYFTEVRMYGEGKLYFSETANGKDYPLMDHEVKLVQKDFAACRDNNYTFEHSFSKESNTEENKFLLNADVTSATIEDESVFPNFLTWFRDLQNDPLALVEQIGPLVGVGGVAVLVIVSVFRKKKKRMRTKGKTRLTNMPRSEKPLNVFTVRDSELQLFCKEAKKCGVPYCVLKDKDAKDGLADIMVRAEDASKINRIFERFELATVDVGEVRSEIERQRQEQAQTKKDKELSTPERTQTEERADAFLDQLMEKPPNTPEQ